MNHIVVCVTLDLPWFHGQQRLGSIESLDLRVFIDAEHQGVLGRVHVQAYDTADLLNELSGPLYRLGRKPGLSGWLPSALTGKGGIVID